MFNRNCLKLTKTLGGITFRNEIFTISMVCFIRLHKFTISLSKRSLFLFHFIQEIFAHRCWRCNTWLTWLYFEFFSAVYKLTRVIFNYDSIGLCKRLLIYLGGPKSICIVLSQIVVLVFCVSIGIRLLMKWCRIIKFSTLNITIAKLLGLSHLSWFSGHRLKLFKEAEFFIGPIFSWMSHYSLRAVSLLKVVTVLAALSSVSTLLDEIGQFNLSLRLGVI